MFNQPILRGLGLEENPAQRSRQERIARLMNKVYAAKITTEDMPFIHAMYQSHHRKFCRKLDQKFEAQMRAKQPLMNNSLSSIKNEQSQANNSSNADNTILNKLDQSMNVRNEKQAGSEIREMKKKVGGEVIQAKQVSSSSIYPEKEERKMQEREKESQEEAKRRLQQLKKSEIKRQKEEQERRQERERKRQIEEEKERERQKQRQKERKRMEEEQRQRQRQLEQKVRKQRQQEERQKRQKIKAEEERLARQAENQRRKAQKMQQQKRKQKARIQQQKALLSQSAHLSDDDLEVVQDDTESYYNVREQIITDIPSNPIIVAKSEIKSEEIKQISFHSHIVSPSKDRFIERGEDKQPQSILEQSHSQSSNKIELPTVVNEEEKVEPSSPSNLERNIEQSLPSETFSLNSNVLTGLESINAPKSQSNEIIESIYLCSQTIEQSQKDECVAEQQQESVDNRVDQIANKFLSLLQEQTGNCEHHQAIMRQNQRLAQMVAQLSKKNEELAKQKEILEKSKRSVIAAQLKAIDLEKQLKKLSERLQQEQCYMLTPGARLIKRNNSQCAAEDKKQPMDKGYNSGQENNQSESDKEPSYESDKNSSDEDES